ncbi:MAG TPA: helix-turn-helix transcriptional regulator [Longimicrobiales bacterium]|nr:helix-turn-helix transcriptional regulator [Longimicrobiales bacterium]
MRLAASDVRRLAAAQAVLLSPLDYETREAWWLACLRAVKEAVRCDIAIFVLTSPTEQAGVTEDFDTGLFDVFGKFDENDLHHLRALRGIVAARTPVFLASEAMLRHCSRRIEDTRIYQEFMMPAGVHDGPGMVVSCGSRTATMAVARSGRKRKRDDFSRERSLLALLAPSLATGVRLMVSIGTERDDLTALLDRSGAAFVIIGEDGREVHRNARFAELLEAEPERERLMEATAKLRARAERDADDISRESTLRIQTSCAAYDVSAVSCAPASFGYRTVVVVFIHRHGPAIPSAEQLHQHWGLSEREAEVALLLARGASNKAIGRALGIRPATVRTHGERVFIKLGVHTRKALGLVLIAN